MDPQALELSKSSARASVPYAGGLAVVFLVMGLVPCLGGCVNFLISLAGFVGVAYLITPKLSGFPAGQSKAMIALYVGLGVAVTVTVGFLIASLIDGILGLAFTSLFRSSQGVFGRAASGFVGLIIGLIVSLVWGLIAGTLLSFLGSYLALDRNKSVEVARPF